jgi:hypothetical protein
LQQRYPTVVLGAAALLGCGLAAFYVLPALMEIKLIAMSQLTSGYFDYHQHYVYSSQWVRYAWGYGGSIAGPDDQMSFQIGPLQWLALLGGLTALGASVFAPAFAHADRRQDAPSATWRQTRREMWCWIAVAALAMFLMTGASVPVWDALPPLAFIQFPWRFLMLLSLASAALAALLLSRLHRYPTTQSAIVLLAAIVMWPLAQPQLKPARYIPWGDYQIDDPAWANSDGATANAFIEVGYTPAQVTRLPKTPVGRWIISDGEGSVRELAVADDRLDLVARSSAGMRLTITSHDFPGWKAWMDRQDVLIHTEPGTGYIQVDVPPGTHRVEARLTNTPVRTAANAISAASLLFVAGSGLALAGRVAAARSRGAVRETAPASGA